VAVDARPVQLTGVLAPEQGTVVRLHEHAEPDRACRHPLAAVVAPDLCFSKTYPPKGKILLPNNKDVTPNGCDLFDTLYDEASEANSCFNICK
jgi:hypothetical protein